MQKLHGFSFMSLSMFRVIVLFEAFRPSFETASSIENKRYLGTVSVLLSIGNNSGQSKGGNANASLKSFSKTPEIQKYDTCKTLTQDTLFFYFELVEQSNDIFSF